MADSTNIINALTLRLADRVAGMQKLDGDTSTIMQIARMNEERKNRQAIQKSAREQHDIADAARIHAVLEKTKQMRAKAAGAIMADASEVPDEYKDQADDFVSGQQGTLTANRARKDADDELQSQKDEAIAGEALKNWPKDQPMTAAAIRAKGFTPRVAGHALRLAGFENTVANQAGMNEDRDASRVLAEDRLAFQKETTAANQGIAKARLDLATDAADAAESAKDEAGRQKQFSRFMRVLNESQQPYMEKTLLGGVNFNEAKWNLENPELAVQWRRVKIAAGKNGVEGVSRETSDPKATRIDELLKKGDDRSLEEDAEFLDLTGGK